MSDYVIAVTTVSDEEHIERIKGAVIDKKLAVCMNVIPSVVSYYWWKNKVKKDEEFIILMKTKKSLVEKLKIAVLSNHPYEVAEFIVIPFEDIGSHYRDWIDGVLG
ncbi:MAG: divalent-cation tolerance protein CutA [archaeon]